MDIADLINSLENDGYEEIATDSGTGSRILVNRKLNRVAKISYDSSYDEFVRFSQKNKSNSFPEVYSYETYNENIGIPYIFSLTIMELLNSLSDDEASESIKWIELYLRAKCNGTLPSDDPMGILSDIEKLLVNATQVETNIDLLKGTNIMKRGDGTFVITDPYN